MLRRVFYREEDPFPCLSSARTTPEDRGSMVVARRASVGENRDWSFIFVSIPSYHILYPLTYFFPRKPAPTRLRRISSFSSGLKTPTSKMAAT